MHKEIEKIKKLEGSPRVIKNLFSLDEINNFFEGESSKLMNKLNRGNERNGI